MHNIKLSLFVVFLTLLGACSPKNEYEINNLVIRETPPGSDKGVAYLSLLNHSDKTLVLNYVHTPRTDVIEVHQHLYEDGFMKMRPVKHLSIDPGQRLDFTPGGFHLMLFGIDEPFKSGQTVPFTFEFENYPPKTVEAQVKKL